MSVYESSIDGSTEWIMFVEPQQGERSCSILALFKRSQTDKSQSMKMCEKNFE